MRTGAQRSLVVASAAAITAIALGGCQVVLGFKKGVPATASGGPDAAGWQGDATTVPDARSTSPDARRPGDAATAVTDARLPTPDAGRGTNDGGAANGPFACKGDPLPTTAPATITVGGAVIDRSNGGSTPVSGAAVVVHASSGTTLGSATADAAGNFAIALATGGKPVDAYLHVAAGGLVGTYFFPAAPFAEDSSIWINMVNGLTLDLGYMEAGAGSP